MGKYIGRIEEYNEFYNFKPFALINDAGKIDILSDTDRGNILPQSERMNINFFYSKYVKEDEDFVKEYFRGDPLKIFEFDLDDLEDNYSGFGRNKTGYKVSARSVIQREKLRNLGKDGYYLVLQKKDIGSDSDFVSDKIVLLSRADFGKEEEILIEYDEGFYAGPFTVKYRSYDGNYYIKPEIRENNYTLSGYKREALSFEDIYDWNSNYFNEKIWKIARINRKSQKHIIDLITDEQLLEAFVDSLGESYIEDGKIRISTIEKTLSTDQQSVFAGIVNAEIRDNRIEKLKKLFEDAVSEDKASDEIIDAVSKILVNYPQEDVINSVVERILVINPDLMEKLQTSRIINEKLNGLKNEVAEQERRLEDLLAQQEQSEYVIEEKRKLEAQRLYNEAELNSLQKQTDEIREKYHLADDIVKLRESLQQIKGEIEFKNRRVNEVNNQVREAEITFTSVLNRYQNRILEISIDGFLSNRMLQAASEWEAEQDEFVYNEAAERVNTVSLPARTNDEVLDYLCKSVAQRRTGYSKNTIINIFTCLSQNFLTVFSGEPGCGKTSICKIIGDVLGLNRIKEFVDPESEIGINLDRFIDISVERGWTSKRDLIGYYNPLTKNFDKSNRRMYDALKTMDYECRKGLVKFPFVVLLDEANLSPMEYYWADFMHLCDDLSGRSSINLGENYTFSIPESLHFVATINNDHTTESLSPRLIDRAWIITLPQVSNIMQVPQEVDDTIELLSWDDLKQLFVPSSENISFSSEVQKLYDNLVSRCRSNGISISPRSEIAIKRYWKIASNLMEPDEYDTDPSIVALDYCVSQKILPKIQGSGESYEQCLNDLRNTCKSNGLSISSGLISEILERGNAQMRYYQFFH